MNRGTCSTMLPLPLTCSATSGMWHWHLGFDFRAFKGGGQAIRFLLRIVFGDNELQSAEPEQ